MIGLRTSIAAALAVCSALVNAAEDMDWTYESSIGVPYANTLFLARDVSNNVYVTTFNSTKTPREVVAFKITNATGPRPTVTAFDKFVAPPNRGYSGVAVDNSGSIYLTADQGDGAASFIKKFTPDLQVDTSFGSRGVLATKEIRLLGVTTSRGRVIIAASWARLIFISVNGEYLGMTPELPKEQQALIRDIDIIPSTQEIVGVDRDSVYIFTGGTLEDFQSYHVRALARGAGQPAAGAGIFYNPAVDRIYYTINQGHKLGSISRSAPSQQTIQNVGIEQGISQPADAVVSSDGKTLFVSDLQGSQVVRYRAGGVSAVVSAPSSERREVTATETASAPGAAMTATAFSGETAGGLSAPAVAAPTPEAAVAASTTVEIASTTSTAAAVGVPAIALPTASSGTGALPTPAGSPVGVGLPPLTSLSETTTTTVSAIATPVEASPAALGLPPAATGLPAPADLSGLPPPAPANLGTTATIAASSGTPLSMPTPDSIIAARAAAISGTPLSMPTPDTALRAGVPAIAGTPLSMPTPDTALGARAAAIAGTPLSMPTTETSFPAPATAISGMPGPTTAATALASPPVAAGTPGPSAIPWVDSPDAAFAQAAAGGKRVAVFFYSPESDSSREVERTIFADPAFAAKHNALVWARVDVTKNPESMATYGFFKVPIVILYGPDRKELKRVEGAFKAAEFDAAVAGLR